MHFPVPQFIEREAKVIGPLTFRQSLFIGIPFGICFLLYLSLASKNFALFLVISILLLGAGFALAFLKVKGVALPTFLMNAFKFYLFQSKSFFWQKKESQIAVFEISFQKETKKEEKPTPLTVFSKNKISKLKSEKSIF
jgi:hypothetical protein